MTDDHADAHGHDDGHDHGGRSTAPQSAYTLREVGIGLAVTAVGLVVTFGVPLALTL
jgi:hypothetical protein